MTYKAFQCAKTVGVFLKFLTISLQEIIAYSASSSFRYPKMSLCKFEYEVRKG
jgi:hypothetical protein